MIWGRHVYTDLHKTVSSTCICGCVCTLLFCCVEINKLDVRCFGDWESDANIDVK